MPETDDQLLLGGRGSQSTGLHYSRLPPHAEIQWPPDVRFSSGATAVLKRGMTCRWRARVGCLIASGLPIRARRDGSQPAMPEARPLVRSWVRKSRRPRRHPTFERGAMRCQVSNPPVCAQPLVGCLDGRLDGTAAGGGMSLLVRYPPANGMNRRVRQPAGRMTPLCVVCVYVCLSEREREWDREREGERERRGGEGGRERKGRRAAPDHDGRQQRRASRLLPSSWSACVWNVGAEERQTFDGM